MNFKIILADVAIEINHNHNYIKELCSDYIVENSVKTEFSVSVTEEEVNAEMDLTEHRFSIDICESTCIHRKVVNGLVKSGVILMHSAVVEVDGNAYVFLAKSGVGKSTHLRMWQEYFGDRAVIVNGDKPMFAFVEKDTGKSELMVYGSPWRGKEHQGANIAVKVKALCILERGEENSIVKASQSEVVSKIFHQVLMPLSEPDLSSFLEIMNRIITEVPCYRLRCNISPEAAEIAYNFMNCNDI